MDQYGDYAQSISDNIRDITETPATESFDSIKKTLTASYSKVSKAMEETAVELLESVAANIVVLANNLCGYKMSKKSIELMDSMIDLFEDIVKNCTYDLARVFQGLTKNDLEKGVPVFELKSLSSKANNQNLINTGAVLLKKYKEYAEVSKDVEFASYQETVKIQKRVIHLEEQLLKMSKLTKAGFVARVKAEKLGMGDYINTMLSYNKKDVAQIGAMLISTFGLLYVKPQENLEGASPKTATAIKTLTNDIDTIIIQSNKIV